MTRKNAFVSDSPLSQPEPDFQEIQEEAIADSESEDPNPVIKYALDFSQKGEALMRGNYETLTELKNAVNLLGVEFFEGLPWNEIADSKRGVFNLEVGNRKLICTLQ